MTGLLKSLVFAQTSRDTSIVFAGTIINIVVGGLFFIFAPRILGPSDYGLFAVVTSTGVVIASLANLGIDTGVLRFVKLESASTQKFLKLALLSYLTAGISVLVLGFLTAPLLAKILGHPSIIPLLRIAFAGIIFMLLADFFVATLQSKKDFFKASLVYISANVVRILALAAAAYFAVINLYFLTILFFFVTIVSVIVGKFFVPFDFLKSKIGLSDTKSFFGFNFWIAASLAISSIPFDNYLLLKFTGAAATGIYAAPYKILSAVDQLAGNFSRVLAPRLSSFKNDREAIKFAIKSIPLVILVNFGILTSIIFAKPLVLLLFGAQYIDSIIIFQIVALAYIFYFANTIPVSLIIYYFGKSKIVFIITLVVTTSWIILAFLLIPRLAALGAAIADLIAGVISVFLFSSYVIWQFYRRTEHG